METERLSIDPLSRLGLIKIGTSSLSSSALIDSVILLWQCQPSLYQRRDLETLLLIQRAELRLLHCLVSSEVTHLSASDRHTLACRLRSLSRNLRVVGNLAPVSILE